MCFDAYLLCDNQLKNACAVAKNEVHILVMTVNILVHKHSSYSSLEMKGSVQGCGAPRNTTSKDVLCS